MEAWEIYLLSTLANKNSEEKTQDCEQTFLQDSATYD